MIKGRRFSVHPRKKLLFVIPSLSSGGAERVVAHLIKHLSKQKYDISVVIFEDGTGYHDNLNSNVKIICLGRKKRLNSLRWIPILSRILRYNKPDVVISFIFYHNIITTLASLLSREKFILILSERSYPPKYLQNLRFEKIVRWLMKMSYGKADGVIAVSKSVKVVLNEDFGIPLNKIKVIYNPIPLDEVRDKSRRDAKFPFQIDDNSKIIISAGRLVKAKRFDNLLKAFYLLRKKRSDVNLLILGEGILLKELQLLALKLGISEQVNFVGFQDNPYAWFSKADIFVLSSDYEGCPNVLIEAMACGVPIISTDCPGAGELIANNINGILIPPSDEEALAEAMNRLLQDESARRRFSQEGSKKVEDFSVEKIMEQYEQFF